MPGYIQSAGCFQKPWSKQMATEMATIRWIGGAVDRAVYTTDSASEFVPTVAEKAAHIFVGFSSNRGKAAPGMLSLAVFLRTGRQTSFNMFQQVPCPMQYGTCFFTTGIVSGMKGP